MYSSLYASVVGVLACLSFLIQPVIAQVYTNTTTTSSAIASAPTNATGVSNFPGWRYAGCQYDTAHFPDFILVQSGASMTVDTCTGSCTNSKYASLLDSNCYCGNNLAPLTTIFPEASCNLRCAGSSAEKCGGDLLLATKRSMSNKRDIAGAIVVSLYEQVVPPAGITFTTIIVTTYVTICPTGATLSPTAATATLTLTHCGCTNPPAATIPMTAVATVCGCGPAGAPSTVILTVPAIAVATAVGTVVVPKPSAAPFTGSAGRTKVAAGVMMAAVGIAAALV